MYVLTRFHCIFNFIRQLFEQRSLILIILKHLAIYVILFSQIIKIPDKYKLNLYRYEISVEPALAVILYN